MFFIECNPSLAFLCVRGAGQTNTPVQITVRSQIARGTGIGDSGASSEEGTPLLEPSRRTDATYRTFVGVGVRD